MNVSQMFPAVEDYYCHGPRLHSMWPEGRNLQWLSWVTPVTVKLSMGGFDCDLTVQVAVASIRRDLLISPLMSATMWTHPWRWTHREGETEQVTDGGRPRQGKGWKSEGRGFHNEIQTGQKKKKRQSEKHTVRELRKKLKWKPAENKEKQINHQQQTDQEHQRDPFCQERKRIK